MSFKKIHKVVINWNPEDPGNGHEMRKSGIKPESRFSLWKALPLGSSRATHSPTSQLCDFELV